MKKLTEYPCGCDECEEGVNGVGNVGMRWVGLSSSVMRLGVFGIFFVQLPPPPRQTPVHVDAENPSNDRPPTPRVSSLSTVPCHPEKFASTKPSVPLPFPNYNLKPLPLSHLLSCFCDPVLAVKIGLCSSLPYLLVQL